MPQIEEPDAPTLFERLALWLTPAASGTGSEQAYRQSLLTGFGLITLPFALLYAAVSHIVGYRVGVHFMLICFALLVAILAAVRTGGRFRLCANLYLATCFFVAILGCSFYSGGIHSMVLPWFTLVPITSVLLFEFGVETIVWTVLTVATLLAYGLGGMAGFEFPVRYDVRYTDFFNTVCIVGLAIILSLIAWMFGRNRSQALAMARTALHHAGAARDEAEAANRAKSRFLASASHDLRQPIQAMRLFQDTLARTSLDGEQRRMIDLLSRSTESLADILNALLDISKLDSGGVTPQWESVGADALFGRLETEYAAVAQAKGLRLKFFRPRRDWALITDGKLLRDVLRNLIDNAIKYTRAGGVLVGVRRRGDGVLIQVWDTGIGVAAEYRESIFEEYVQIDNPQRDRTQGLGLGLAIVRRLTHILGGQVRCRSRSGKGSLFEVEFPNGDAEFAAAVRMV